MNTKNNINHIKILTTELLQYCHEYYDLDNPTISDRQYDEKFDKLIALEDDTNFWLSTSPTRKVQGKVLDGFKKITHTKPMLSAAKTKDPEEIKKFIGDKIAYCSWKLDGLTLVVVYDNGELIQAITRGTGLVGEDVTEQAKMIRNLPLHINYNNRLELRGECVVSWDRFNKINETLDVPYSHPRNLASGSLRNLDTNITKERGLSYVVFECVTDIGFDEKLTELEFLDELGFETVGVAISVKDGIVVVEDCINDMNPSECEYPVDGLIFEINNNELSKKMPSTSHHEGCRMALKWKDDLVETILRDIVWNTTRSGIISPVAVFDEVDLDGAKTTRATLHNVSIVESLQLGIGDKILVYRSNMVIPKIDSNLTRSNTYQVPNVCPCCGSKTEIRESEQSRVLYCVNMHCPAKIVSKFTHFVSRDCMNIDGLSESRIDQLVTSGLIENYVDIFNLKQHKEKLEQLPRLGKKSVENLLASIEKSRQTNLLQVINALGIDGVGVSSSKIIAKFFIGKSPYAFIQAGLVGMDWTQLPDIGNITSKNINSYIQNNSDMITSLFDKLYISNNDTNTSGALNGVKFCITGTFDISRKELRKLLEDQGAVFSSSVTKNLDLLFCGTGAGSKLTKAKSLGISIVTEKELGTYIKR